MILFNNNKMQTKIMRILFLKVMKLSELLNIYVISIELLLFLALIQI